ncbi:uncharacterized protein L201_003673 [Kwoniella dendrophila CBS 6074]|uniref:Uncharacterized protein n=1 Tax=Kwoniella dendrophila CBS 6074 TaxID=1295534 RepID=A0AAX4JW21_9TREE
MSDLKEFGRFSNLGLGTTNASREQKQDEVMQNPTATVQDIKENFRGEIDLEDPNFNMYFGEFDLETMIRKHHRETTTMAARNAVVTAMFETALTNPLLAIAKAGNARDLLNDWDDLGDDEKNRNSFGYFLDPEDDIGAKQVLEWQYKDPSSNMDSSVGLPTLSEYGREMFSVTLPLIVLDTLYRDGKSERTPGRIPTEALDQLPERSRSWAQDVWRIKEMTLSPEFPESASQLTTWTQQMKLRDVFKSWNENREKDAGSYGQKPDRNYQAAEGSWQTGSHTCPTMATIDPSTDNVIEVGSPGRINKTNDGGLHKGNTYYDSTRFYDSS